MAALTAANAVTLADGIAKHIIDLVAVPGSTSAITTGQATLLGQVVALNDASQITALLDGFNASVTAEKAYLTNQASYNAILDLWFGACLALDAAASGGLAALLAANQPNQVDYRFLDAFNRADSKGGVNPVAALPAWLSFAPAALGLATFAVTGSGAGTFTAGTAVSSLYGNGPLSLYNAGAGVIGAASITATVTYTKYSSTGTVLTAQTATATLTNGAASGAAVALSGSAAGTAVTNITITGGTNGDSIGVKTTLLRSVSY